MADAQETAAAPEGDAPSAEEQAFEAGLKGEEPAAPEGGDKPAEDAKKDETEGDGEDKPATDETKADDNPDAGKDGEGEEDNQDEDPESQRKATARQGYAERKATREAVTSLLDTVAKPQSEQDLIDNQGLDPADARLEVFKQEQQRKEAIQELTDLNTGIKSDAQNVVRDFPMFDANSKDFDEKLTEEVDQLWKEAADFKTDQSGQIVLQARIPMYKFYAAFAGAKSEGFKSGQKAGEAAGQKAAEKMFASAETPAATKETVPAADGMTEEDWLFLKGLTG
jgi:hypothetical protein